MDKGRYNFIHVTSNGDPESLQNVVTIMDEHIKLADKT
jgi:hypothetical protein